MSITEMEADLTKKAKEMKYRSWHSLLCMVIVLFGTGVSFLAGTGELYLIAQTCVWLAIMVQWSVILRGRKKDKKEKTAREIEELASLIKEPHAFKHYAYLHPVQRGRIKRWYDKWKGITYVHLWTYNFDLDEKIHEFESEIKFPVTDKQLFEMKLRNYIDIDDPKDVLLALDYLGADWLIPIDTNKS